MDNSAQKIFLCKPDGSVMFSKDKEDLFIHEKKHEIQLNLSLQDKSTNMFVDNVDQTPTPTRLIKNCEEIGLFDDLKHVNPFDETFRRAVESKQIDHHHHQQQQHISTDDNGTYDTATANDCLITNEDSLHTPQVFPNVGSAATSGTITTTVTEFRQREEFLIPKQDVILSETILKNNEKNCDNYKGKSEKVTNVEKSQNLKRQKLINNKDSIQNHAINQKPKKHGLPKLLPKIDSQNEITTKSIILPNSFNIIQPQIILELPVGAVLQSKPILLPNTVELKNIINPIAQTSQPQTQQILTVKEKLKNVLNNTNSTSQSSKNTKINVNKYHSRQTKHVSEKKCNDNKKKESFLERGREAASRYRKRIKRNNEILNEKCEKLIAENEMLKATVKELQQKLKKYENSDLEGEKVCSSQNSIESVIQTPKIIKLLVNEPDMTVQQNQHSQSILLRNNDTNKSL